MTTISLLFGAGLFALLLFIFLVVMRTQVSPQSAMLEEVVRETRLRKKAADSDAGLSSAFLEWIAAPVAFVRGFFSQNPDTAIVRRLATAGYRERAHADLFLGARLAVPALCGLTVALLIPENAFFFFAIAVIVGFFAPDFWLAEAVKRRKERIGSVLPDALDMVSICLDAGLGLDQAIVRVGQELRSTYRDLSDELMQINFEQRAGVPRIDSWRAFADRIDIDSLRQFVAMLVQTERFGTPLGGVELVFRVAPDRAQAKSRRVGCEGCHQAHVSARLVYLSDGVYRNGGTGNRGSPQKLGQSAAIGCEAGPHSKEVKNGFVNNDSGCRRSSRSRGALYLDLPDEEQNFALAGIDDL